VIECSAEIGVKVKLIKLLVKWSFTVLYFLYDLLVSTLLYCGFVTELLSSVSIVVSHVV